MTNVSKESNKKVINNSKDIFEEYKYLGGIDSGVLRVLCLDGNEIIHEGNIREQKKNDIDISHEDILKALNISFSKGKCNIILIRNTLSQEVGINRYDLDRAEKLNEIAIILGIELIDYIVISKSNYISVRGSNGFKY